jgi:hypothetical protein
MTAGFLHARHSERLLDDLHAGRKVSCTVAGRYVPTDDPFGIEQIEQSKEKQKTALLESYIDYCQYGGELVAEVTRDGIEMRADFIFDRYLRKSPFTVEDFGHRWTRSTYDVYLNNVSGIEIGFLGVLIGVVVALVDNRYRRRRSMACE